MDKIFYSMYVSEIVNNFGIEDDPCSEEIYNLLYKSLNKISEAESKEEILIAAIKFQLKMMQISGFGIELNTCLCCREEIGEENMYFSSRMGGVVCSECSKELHVPTIMHHKIRDFLNSLLQFDFDFKSEYEEKANEKVCMVCFDLLKNYINEHSQKKFNTTNILQEV